MNPVTNRGWKIAAAALWIFVPLVAFRNWQLWDRLPVRMATHFNAAGNPNGWMSREGALEFILAATLITAVAATAALWWARTPRAAHWAALGVFYVVMGGMYYGEESILAYNVAGTPVHIVPILIAGLLVTLASIGLCVGAGRGADLSSPGPMIAREVHSSPIIGSALCVPAAAILIFAAKAPANVRFVLGVPAAVLLLASIMAWSGFQYLFTQSGIEIRTLGFRLRSVAGQEIESYKIEPWSPIHGYGIRGLGTSRAYVWANRGVRISTTEGQVFLGHRDPERIVRDLDAVKQFAR